MDGSNGRTDPDGGTHPGAPGNRDPRPVDAIGIGYPSDIASTTEGHRRAACNALSAMFLRDDGWLRVVPGGDGKNLFIKWKFSRGRHAGNYVMAVVRVWEWDSGMQLLEKKLWEVDAGIRRPTRDRHYTEDDGSRSEL